MPEPSSVSSVSSGLGLHGRDEGKRVREVSQQFESLLLSEILKSAKGSEEGWLGAGSDSSSDTALDYGIEVMANAIASRGGLGLASVIQQGLAREKQESGQAAN